MAVIDEQDTITVGGVDYHVMQIEVDSAGSTSTWIARRLVNGRYIEVGRFVAADTETLANAITALVGTADP